MSLGFPPADSTTRLKTIFHQPLGIWGCESTGMNPWIQMVNFYYASTWMFQCVGGPHLNPALFKGKLHIFFKFFFKVDLGIDSEKEIGLNKKVLSSPQFSTPTLRKPSLCICFT